MLHAVTVQVTASAPVVLERARRRAEMTRRVIPRDVMMAAIEEVRVHVCSCIGAGAVHALTSVTQRIVCGCVCVSHAQAPRAVAGLAPLADYCVHIDNEHEEPTIVSEGETWQSFAAVWRPRCQISPSSAPER